MEKAQAKELVKQTFTQTFDKGRFHRFIKELLNHVDESKAQVWNHTYVKDAFKDHVQRYERLGTYTTPKKEKVDILIVHLTGESKLERARTAIRNFVADHLKTRDEKDAALVAFVSPKETTWRFSYVKMEYATIEKDSGKIGVESRLTPARRFSYLVGEGESCHTAQTRFLDLLKDTETNPSLTNIEAAFSVEAVTKEFFEQYKTLFLDLKDELDGLAKNDNTISSEFSDKKIGTADFAKKLMGQIVFLYFLQKKGWMGVPKGGDWGNGPHNFLQQLFNGKFCSFKNFFNDILEPLFYDTLATDRKHEAWCDKFHCRIPFLNGGLFEPLRGYDWQKTDIIIPNNLFSNTKLTKDGITGTGILDVFDRYNFTVNEAEPLEKEVAIDPEMLGKVFENLLGVDERKSKGSFYTPREIVHYMCQESLINHLDTALNQEKEIVSRKDLETFIHLGEQISHYEAVDAKYSIKMPATVAEHARVIDEKLASITVCDPAIGSGAFPVGMMQEIVRARSALTSYFNDVHDRNAYHFKRHAIQSCLYGVDIDPGAVEIAKLRLWLSLVVDEDDVKQIKPLPNLDYKVVTGNSLLSVEKNLFNAALFRQLEELKPRYFDATDRKQKEKFKHAIDDLIHELTNGKETFDFEIYFSEIFHQKKGFDIVIMNPPYGVDFSKADKETLKRKYDHIAERIRNSFMYFLGLAYDITKNGGVVSVIQPNEFLFQIYMTKARRFFVANAQILYAINTGEDVFDAVVPTCVISFQKRKLASYKIPVADLRKCTLEELASRLDTSSFALSSSDIVLATPNSIFAFDLDSTALVNKLAAKFAPFGEYCNDVAYGICTSCDEIYIVTNKFAKSEGLEKNYLKPCIRGGQLNRYYCPPTTNEYVLYITGEFDPKIGKNIDRYLSANKAMLIRKSVEKKGGARQWNVLFRARYEGLFKKPKILIRQTADRIIAAPDTEVGYYCINSVHVALLKEEFIPQLNFLVGLLNSSLLNFFYREISQEGGRVLAEVKPQRIRSLPISDVSFEKQKPVERLVERILSTKQSDVEADVSALEREIDELVYVLYGLTKEEIEIVERNGA